MQRALFGLFLILEVDDLKKQGIHNWVLFVKREKFDVDYMQLAYGLLP